MFERMRYDAFTKESLHIRSQADALRDVGDRKYVLREGSAEWGAPFEKRQLQVRVSVIPNENGPSIFMGVEAFVEAFGSGTINDIGHLTSTDLHRLAEAREIVQEWINGKRESLPARMPWETTECD